jgi:hypothetical protein
MATTNYPDVLTNIKATLPIEHATHQAVMATEFENGVEQRRLVQDSVRRKVLVNYSSLDFDQANEIRRFYEARQGAFEEFFFYFPQEETYTKELVGVMPSPVVTTLILPSFKVGVSDQHDLYKNNALLTEGVDWNFTPAVSSYTDEASLLFTPAGGDIFHYSFQGRLVIRARFSMSPLIFSDVKKYWSDLSVELVGLEPDLVKDLV